MKPYDKNKHIEKQNLFILLLLTLEYPHEKTRQGLSSEHQLLSSRQESRRQVSSPIVVESVYKTLNYSKILKDARSYIGRPSSLIETDCRFQLLLLYLHNFLILFEFEGSWNTLESLRSFGHARLLLEHPARYPDLVPSDLYRRNPKGG